MSLQDYIDAEDRALKQSLLQYPEHYRLFGELDDLYDALIHGRVLTENDIVLPLVFVLVVQRHLLGVASLLLRRRVTDAACLTRRAIEVTASGHYLSNHPESKEVTQNALFTEATPPWPALRALYDRFGAMPAPAGLVSPSNMKSCMEL